MKKVIYKSISMILAGILCVSILAGCSDAQSDGSKGAEKELSEGSVMKNAAILPSVTFEGDPYEFMTGEDYSKWWNEHRELIMQSADLKEYTEDFYTKAMEAFLTSEEKNLVCSPLNLYMALAILAETSEGETRSQVLELLGEETIDSLRTHASAVWQANYDDNPVLKCHLANSLWLNSDITYKEPLLDTLTSGYFADIFSGTMGTEKMDEALQKWTDEHTGGLLSEYISDIKTDPEAVMELISAIYFKATWIDKFNKDDNTTETFHGLNGDTECDMMHMSGSDIYFWGDRFTAALMGIAEGYSMYFILPDEGEELSDVISDPQVFELIKYGNSMEYENNKYIIVNKSIPKFSISSKIDAKEILESLGIKDAFDSSAADFTPVTDLDGIYISKVDHAAMVEIDEEGVTGAAYTDIMYAGAGMPPEEEVDFVLDRPFMYVITAPDGSLLFAGTVYDLD